MNPSASNPAGPTSVAGLHGIHGLAPWIRGSSPTRDVCVVVDDALVGSDAHRVLFDELRYHGLRTREIDAPRRCTPGSIESLRDWLGHSHALALGGGTVMDAVKLAATARRRPDLLPRLAASQRGGLLTLPPRPADRGTHPVVVAIPTTMGTGSEVGPVACVDHPDGKRIICGPGLRPDAAVWDGLCTETLPIALILSGAAEALFRTISPYVGDPTVRPRADAEVEALVPAIVQCADRIAALRDQRSPIPTELRTALARLSAASQYGHTNAGRNPYSVRGWALGTELAHEAGIPKMAAIGLIWPLQWRRILAEDSRWGSATRVDRIWSLVTAATADVSGPPDQGISTLLQRWLPASPISLDHQQVESLTRRAIHRWGAGLPVLGGLDAESVRGLYRDLSPHTSPGRLDQTWRHAS